MLGRDQSCRQVEYQAAPKRPIVNGALGSTCDFYGGRPGTHWFNSVTRVLPATPVPYNRVLCAPFIKAPILMMVAPDDEMVHADYSVAKLAYQLMPDQKAWHDIAGGHFGLLYYPDELFDEATRVQTEFFKERL